MLFAARVALPTCELPIMFRTEIKLLIRNKIEFPLGRFRMLMSACARDSDAMLSRNSLDDGPVFQHRLLLLDQLFPELVLDFRTPLSPLILVDTAGRRRDRAVLDLDGLDSDLAGLQLAGRVHVLPPISSSSREAYAAAGAPSSRPASSERIPSRPWGGAPSGGRGRRRCHRPGCSSWAGGPSSWSCR